MLQGRIDHVDEIGNAQLVLRPDALYALGEGRINSVNSSLKLDPRGPQGTAPLAPDGTLRPEWLAMLRAFPDRFMIGSDQFLDEGVERLAAARRLVDALPADVARLVASENARRIYRLDGKPR